MKYYVPGIDKVVPQGLMRDTILTIGAVLGSQKKSSKKDVFGREYAMTFDNCCIEMSEKAYLDVSMDVE